jgi:hypothetical protein
MNFELFYSYLLSSSWLFLGGWSALIIYAAVVFLRAGSVKPPASHGTMRQN